MEISWIIFSMWQVPILLTQQGKQKAQLDRPIKYLKIACL